ncbi:hypothetical protein II906_00645, partial [bacterium]|nr:hypothetical protein [bacterium]
MNFEQIKMGFKSYIEPKLSEEERAKLTDSTDFNIFRYGKEFKEYLVEEVGADASIFSKNITDILKMEFVNGKFVVPEEEEELLNSDEEITDEQSEQMKFNADFMAEALNDFLSQENIQGFLDADSNGELSQEEATGFVSMISDKETGEFSFDKLMDISEIVGEDDVNTLLDKMYNNEDVMKAIDEDGNGELSDAEKSKFQNIAANLDKNADELSADDLKKAYYNILSGDLSGAEKPEEEPETTPSKEPEVSPSKEPEAAPTTAPTAETKPEQTPSSQSSSPAAQASSPSGNSGSVGSSGGGGSVGGSSGGGGSSSGVSSGAYNSSPVSTSGEKSEDDKLNQELEDAKAELSDKQTALDDLKTKHEQELTDLETEVQTQYDKMQEELKKTDSELAEKIDTQNGLINDKQTEIDTNNELIFTKKQEVSDTKSA